jgi:hypothetical protein
VRAARSASACFVQFAAVPTVGPSIPDSVFGEERHSIVGGFGADMDCLRRRAGWLKEDKYLLSERNEHCEKINTIMMRHGSDDAPLGCDRSFAAYRY